jgi:hypothetical protein
VPGLGPRLGLTRGELGLCYALKPEQRNLSAKLSHLPERLTGVDRLEELLP